MYTYILQQIGCVYRRILLYTFNGRRNDGDQESDFPIRNV